MLNMQRESFIELECITVCNEIGELTIQSPVQEFIDSSV
jgi:hypothetical protein